jgi:hypothetical protein
VRDLTILVVEHKVRDFGAWKSAFDEHEPLRREHGARRHWLYRTAEDPNEVVVAIQFSPQLQGRAFLEDPSVREAMQRAGVEDEPRVHFGELLEVVDY